MLFDSLRSPFGPAFGCYSRWSLRLFLRGAIGIVLPASPTSFNGLLKVLPSPAKTQGRAVIRRGDVALAVELGLFERGAHHIIADDR